MESSWQGKRAAAGILEADRTFSLVDRGVMTEEEALLTTATTTIGTVLIAGGGKGIEGLVKALSGSQILKGSAKGVLKDLDAETVVAAGNRIVKKADDGLKVEGGCLERWDSAAQTAE